VSLDSSSNGPATRMLSTQISDYVDKGDDIITIPLEINTADDNEDEDKVLQSNYGINGPEPKCAHINYEASN
jgi:hypothetical protein